MDKETKEYLKTLSDEEKIEKWNEIFGDYKSYKLSAVAKMCGFTGTARPLLPAVLRADGFLTKEQGFGLFGWYYKNLPSKLFLMSGYFEVKNIKVCKFLPFIKRSHTLVTMPGIRFLQEWFYAERKTM